jgi:hypothetical protein
MGDALRGPDDAALSFLDLPDDERMRGMVTEARLLLEQEMQATLNVDRPRGTFLTALRMALGKYPTAPDVISYYENAFEQLAKSDASMEFKQTLQDRQPFALYLRAYQSEGIEELMPEGERESARLGRSVEIGNLARISERIAVYGLCNVLDVNPQKKYKSVWLPPPYRRNWIDIVGAVARKADLIIVNATVPGSGLSVELAHIVPTFPKKTWLLAGTIGQSGEFITRDVAAAAAALAGHRERVSKAVVDKDGIHYASPDFPDWIKDIVAAVR